MGPLLYMWSVINWSIAMWHVTIQIQRAQDSGRKNWKKPTEDTLQWNYQSQRQRKNIESSKKKCLIMYRESSMKSSVDFHEEI